MFIVIYQHFARTTLLSRSFQESSPYSSIFQVYENPGNTCKSRCDQNLCAIYVFLFVGLDSLGPSQPFFSYVGTGLPGLNQY